MPEETPILLELKLLDRETAISILRGKRILECWKNKPGNSIVDQDGFPDGIFTLLKFPFEYDDEIRRGYQIFTLVPVRSNQ